MGRRVSGMFALAGATGLLTAAVIFVDGRPGTALGFIFGNAAVFVAFGDVVGFAILLVSVLGFVTTGHGMVLFVNDQK